MPIMLVKVTNIFIDLHNIYRLFNLQVGLYETIWLLKKIEEEIILRCRFGGGSTIKTTPGSQS